MTVEELERLAGSGQRPLLLDVRSAFEYRSGHIANSVHAPLTTLLQKTAALAQDKNTSIILTCEHGPRAQLARLMLKFSGFKNLELLDGHMAGWRRSGRPLKKGNDPDATS